MYWFIYYFLIINVKHFRTWQLRPLHTESEIFACIFPFFFSFPIKMHATDAKTQKIEPDRNFFWRTKVSEAVCKRDWQREVVFIFYVRKCRTQCAETFTVLIHFHSIEKSGQYIFFKIFCRFGTTWVSNWTFITGCTIALNFQRVNLKLISIICQIFLQ